MLELSYIMLAVVMNIILIAIGMRAINGSETDGSKAKSKKMKLVLGLFLWQLYILVISLSGVLETLTPPPRFVILLIMQVFIFTGVFLYKQRNKAWIHEIPFSWITFYQSFRIIIESIFVASVAAGVLNKEVTVEGYNYDMFFGFSAIIVGLIVIKSNRLPKTILTIWNYTGLFVITVIIFLFQASLFFPEIFGSNEILIPIGFTNYPYTIVPGFLMPSAVFIHVLSLVKLKKLKN